MSVRRSEADAGSIEAAWDALHSLEALVLHARAALEAGVDPVRAIGALRRGQGALRLLDRPEAVEQAVVLAEAAAEPAEPGEPAAEAASEAATVAVQDELPLAGAPAAEGAQDDEGRSDDAPAAASPTEGLVPAAVAVGCEEHEQQLGLSCVPGEMEMKVTTKKSTGFYVRLAKSFLTGFEGKDGKKMEAVCVLRISGLGEAINSAVAAATAVEAASLGTIKRVETAYPEIHGRRCARIVITVYNK